MNFKQLVLFVEATSQTGRPPGIGILLPFDFEGSIEEAFYSRYYGHPDVKIPQNIQKEIEPKQEEEKKFRELTKLNRPPTPEEKTRLSNAIIELMRRNPVLGNVISLMPVVYSTSIDTFAVDTRGNLLINLGYANMCSNEQLVGVLAHEAMHVTLSHFSRLRGRDMRISNIATDALINNELLSDGYEVGYGMGIQAVNGKISLRLMYLMEDVPDIQKAKPLDFKIEVDISNKTWEQLYDILEDLLSNPKKWQLQKLKVGSVIYDTQEKTYGIVQREERGYTVIQPCSYDEAKKYLKSKS